MPRGIPKAKNVKNAKKTDTPVPVKRKPRVKKVKEPQLVEEVISTSFNVLAGRPGQPIVSIPAGVITTKKRQVGRNLRGDQTVAVISNGLLVVERFADAIEAGKIPNIEEARSHDTLLDRLLTLGEQIKDKIAHV